MIQILFISLFIAFITSIGKLWNGVFVHWSERIAASYTVSIAIYTFTLFVAYLAGLPFSTLHSILVLMALWLITEFLGWVINKKIKIQETSKSIIKSKNVSTWERVLFGILGIIGVVSVVTSFYWPVRDWDSLVLYDFRAKVFLHTGGMEDGIARGYFFGYPLLTSIIHTVAYQAGFSTPTFLHSFYYVSLITCVFWGLRRVLPQSWALFITFCIAIYSPLVSHSMMTYTNLAYTTYIVLTVLYSGLWLKLRDFRFGTLSGLLLFGSMWTRSNEPFWLISIILMLFVAVRFRQWFVALFQFLLVYMVRALWVGFEQDHLTYQRSITSLLPNYIQSLLSVLNPQMLIQVIEYIWRYVIYPTWFSFLLAVMAMSISWWKMKKIEEVVLFQSIFVVLVIGITVAGTLILTTTDLKWDQIGDSAQRMTMFLNPILWIILGFSITPFLNLDKKKHAK